MIRLTYAPIDTQQVLEHIQSEQAGACVVFVGTTREFTAGRQTRTLVYDAYPAMAEKKLDELRQQATQRWNLTRCAVVHRLGEVGLGEASIVVGVSAAHRREAFAAAEWLMDTLKAEVPIWKQEHWADGSTEWVHPGAPIGAEPKSQAEPKSASLGAAPESGTSAMDAADRHGSSPFRGAAPEDATDRCANSNGAERIEPLVDSWGRVHTSLRLSVTDRCNIRCFYCMPDEQLRFMPRSELLTFEELTRAVRTLLPLGINRVRLTGGEPLVRADLPHLVRQLSGLPGLREVSLTTNGLLLAEHAQALRDAGLTRINISLDALSPENFVRIARRPGLEQVLEGIAAAQRVGWSRIRLNAVAIRGITEDEVVPLARFARERGLELRFIEFMPLDAEQQWQQEQVLSGETLRRILEAEWGPLVPCPRDEPSQPARDYAFADGRGRIGFINPVSQPFCADCNRLRLTADGKVRNCLFSTVEWDLRALLRADATDDEVRTLVRECVAAKKPAHGLDQPAFERPARAMYQIGG